jgi:hypothetical protein
MSDVIIVAIISGICTLAGTFFGILKTSSMTNYRIEKLEDKVDKHNNLVERMALAERDIREIKEDLKK